MQATFVLVWLLVRLQSEREKRLRQGEEEQDERPNSAWLRSLAAEDLPRCRIHLPMTRVFAILFLTPNEAQVRVLPERWAGRSCDWAHCVRRKVRQRPVHARPFCAAFSLWTVGPLAVQRGGVMPCFAKTAREALETG